MDRLITLLKCTFSKRLARIAAHENVLIEHLESVQVVESCIGKTEGVGGDGLVRRWDPLRGCIKT